MRDRLALQALSSLGGVAGLIVGLLYLAGLLVKITELREAGLSITDTFTLYPVEQVLRTGMALVGPALAFLGAASLLMATSVAFERRLGRFAEEYLKTLVKLPKGRRPAWLPDYAAAAESTDWSPVAKRIADAHRAARKRDNKSRTRELARARLWFACFDYVLAPIIVISVLVSYAFMLQPLIALGAGAMWLVSLLFLGLAGTIRPVQHQLAVWYTILLVGLAVSAFAYPHPLPNGTVVTDNQGTVTGRLVLVDSSTWYLSAPQHSIRTVTSDHVLCSRIAPSQPREPRTVVWLFDDEPKPPPALPPLKCARSPASAGRVK